MRVAIRVLTGVSAAAVALAALAPPAAAAPSWKWGRIVSADGMGAAWGKVTARGAGLVVSGYVDDTRGRGCTWLLIRYQDSGNGRWRTHGVYNCVPGAGSFSKRVGDPLQIKAQVCRGTARRPVDECSRWKTVFTQGG
ncbi:hypothetical protein [Nonomuraea pusilla]|uniref:Secreted protein n=1 Tax=Nonomuraea pusilla TaxID=46177 RepID=A0A1H7U3D3_9ACTN|nr:hypothetical protein [Nonomuraea pusilla]SEL91334.1 hypothetical protein SAMN05660976_03644 [Nonomuraea pusilla]